MNVAMAVSVGAVLEMKPEGIVSETELKEMETTSGDGSQRCGRGEGARAKCRRGRRAFNDSKCIRVVGPEFHPLQEVQAKSESLEPEVRGCWERGRALRIRMEVCRCGAHQPEGVSLKGGTGRGSRMQ